MILTQPQVKPWQDPLSTFPCLCQGSRRFMRPQKILAFLYRPRPSTQTPIELLSCGRQNAPGTSPLLQLVSQELQQPDHVLMPYEHRHAAQRATALPPRQLPVDPPDPEGVPETDLGRLPSDGEEFLVPDPPDPACLATLRETPRAWPCSARRSSSPVSISSRLQHVFPCGGAPRTPLPFRHAGRGGRCANGTGNGSRERERSTRPGFASTTNRLATGLVCHEGG